MPNVLEQAAAKITEWLSPLKGSYTVTTQYGAPVAAGSTKGAPHYGVDLARAGIEGTPVYAPANATVKRADSKDPGGGNIVELAFGDSADTTMLFAHLRNFVVQPGETVRAGEIIGYVGRTGASVTGAHLHIEARRAGKLFNPLDLFDGTASSDASAYNDAARRQPLQPDGNCPVGFHRANDGFFGIGGDMAGAYCEADSLPGQVVAGALDWTKGLAEFLAALLDPANWLAWASLGAGAMLSMFGLWMIWNATGA